MVIQSRHIFNYEILKTPICDQPTFQPLIDIIFLYSIFVATNIDFGKFRDNVLCSITLLDTLSQRICDNVSQYKADLKKFSHDTHTLESFTKVVALA